MIAEDDDHEPDYGPNSRVYTFEEVVAGLEGLSDPERGKLKGLSRILAGMADMEPDELLNEAFRRMLDTRTCPIGVDMAGFAIMTMKSIASTARRREEKRVADGITSIPIAANDGGLDPADDALSPEQEALARIFYGKSLARVDAAIADDDELQLLVLGLIDGLFGKKLEQFLDMNTKGLAAARKRLAKRLVKAFPEGSPFKSKD